MPYIKVKVCQDLYQELGLCPNMELVRSDSKGSIKFVPLSDKSVLDDYDSPLITSPKLGNPANVIKATDKSVPNMLPSEPVSNIAVMPSASINEECFATSFKSSHQESGNSDTSGQAKTVSILSEDKVRCTTNELSRGETPSNGVNKSKNVTFLECPDLNKFVYFVDRARSTVKNDSHKGRLKNELTPNKENKILTPSLQVNPIISFPFASPSGYIFVPGPPINSMPSGVNMGVNSETSVLAEQGTVSNDDELKRTTDKCCDDTSQNNPCERGNKSDDLNQFDPSDGEVQVSLKNGDIVNNQLTCNQENTILMMTSALPVNPIVSFNPYANPSGFIIFPHPPVNTQSADVHVSDSSVTSVMPERVARNEEALKIDAPQNYPSEDGTKLEDIFSEDNIDLNQPVSFEDETQCSVDMDNDSNQGVSENVLTPDKGNTILTPGVQVNPFINVTSFTNPTGYILFPNKSTKYDVPRIELDPSGSLSSVVLSIPQLDGGQNTSPFIAEDAMSLKLPGVESKVSPQNMQSTEVPASDLSLQNAPVVKVYSPPNNSTAASASEVPSEESLIADGFTDSSSNVEGKISNQPKEDSNELFIRRRDEKDKRIKLQCQHCSSVYSSKASFSSHINRCDYLREKKPITGGQISIKHPRKCEKCSVMIFSLSTYNRHIRKCRGGVHVHSKRRFIPVESDNVVQSSSLENNTLSKEDGYFLYKNNLSQLLYIKKEVSSKPDK